MDDEAFRHACELRTKFIYEGRWFPPSKRPWARFDEGTSNLRVVAIVFSGTAGGYSLNGNPLSPLDTWGGLCQSLAP